MKIVPRPRVLTLGARPSRRSALPGGLERLEERRLLAIMSVVVPNTTLPGSVTMTGDSSADTLIIDRNGTLLQHNTLTAPAGQSYADNLDFDSTVAGSQNVTDGTLPVTINGGGNDSITLGDSSTAASAFATAFTVNGLPGGNDSLTIDDSADTTSQTITIDNNSVAFSSGPTITYSGLATLTVIASGQTVDILNTPAGTGVTVENCGCSTTDDVTIGDAGLVNGVAGPVNLVSQGTTATFAFALTVNDIADPNPETWALNATSLTGLAPAAISFGSAQLNSLTIAGSNAANNITVSGTPAGIQSEIVTGAGNSTFNVAAAGLGAGSTLFLNGGTGANTLTEDAGLGTLTALTPPNIPQDIPGTIVINNGPTLEYANLQAISINNLADQPLTSAPPVTINASQGQPLTNVTVGSFTDADPNGAAADYTATINWGDGTISAGTITQPGGAGKAFEVQGSHTYATSGTFTGSVSVLDNGSSGTEDVGGVPVTLSDNGGSTASNTFNGNVTSPITVTSPGNQSATAGTSQAFTLGSFTDPNAGATNYTTTIIWGDSTPNSTESQTTQGTITPLAHDYTTAGTYTVQVTVTDNLGAPSNTATFTVNVTSPITVISPGTQFFTPGISHDFTLGSFSDPNAPATSWTETINWGDSTTSTLNLAPGSLGTLAHTYSSAGPFTVTVSVSDNLGATGSNTFIVNEAVLSGTGMPINAVEGNPFSGSLGTFTTSDPRATVADFSATIDWGDPSPDLTGGTIVETSPGVFTVSGTHTYTEETPPGKPDTFSVLITQVGDGKTTFSDTATVADAPLFPAVQPKVAVTEGMTFTLPVGAFVDLNPNAPLSDYSATNSATIDWGDGPPGHPDITPGFITPFSPSGSSSNIITLPNGELASLWLVNGTHTYNAVTNTNNSGLGSLRSVMTDVMKNGGISSPTIVITVNDVGGSMTTIDNTAMINPDNTVVFRIPGTGPFVIQPMTPLPTITMPIVIDATTQPGYAGKPIVVINGDLIPGGTPGDDGLTLDAGETTVKGLVINNFTGDADFISGAGVVLQGAGGDVLENDWIGTDPTGTAAEGNSQGVLIQGSSNNMIGGTGAGQGNVISGNLSVGVQVFNSATVQDPTVTPTLFSTGLATGNVIEGNFIGTNASGTGPLLNNTGAFGQGVWINDAANNSVIDNVIALNRSTGIQVLGVNATGNGIQGNAIGGNRFGIYLYPLANNTVGPNDNASNTTANELVRKLTSGPVVESDSVSEPNPPVLTLNSNGAILTLTFTTYLDPMRAENSNNYVVNLIGRNLAPGARIPVTAAYNNVYRTVTLTLTSAPIAAGAFFEVRVVGRGPNGIRDSSGNFLDGSNILPAPRGGSDALLYFRGGVQVNPFPVSSSKSAGHAEAVDAVLGALEPVSRGVRSRR